eukprot:5937935-Pyramimonas_sp.AAC.2
MGDERVGAPGLASGSLVCLESHGRFLAAAYRGGRWELGSMSERAYAVDSVQQTPLECLFTLLRSRSTGAIGFRSLAAEGRALQAVRERGAAHVFSNSNAKVSERLIYTLHPFRYQSGEECRWGSRTMIISPAS